MKNDLKRLKKLLSSRRRLNCQPSAIKLFGQIPNIEVGMSWKFRHQLSSLGLHIPRMHGISGLSNVGAFSIILSGIYEDDVDNGDEIIYTGCGGRSEDGKEQIRNQKLTSWNNKCLSLNCEARFNVKGSDSGDKWRNGRPVRVFRNSKCKIQSPYKPQSGYRYDGLYKVVKYWKERGSSGYIICRFLLRRDDPIKPPWNNEIENVNKLPRVEIYH